MSGPLIVVGAGSAGAVIAARVSEDATRDVLLLEAGPDYPSGAEPEDLRNGRQNSTERHDWGYRYRPNAVGEPLLFPRGKVVGGSSAVNTCIALRGQPYDYDEWAALGGEHWRWEACLPYFIRLENDLDKSGPYHGNEGPIPIRRHTPSEFTPIQTAFMEACDGLGHPSCDDHNDPTTTGAGPHCMNKIDGVRMNAAMGYLNPNRGRDNLRIEANTTVLRVLFDPRGHAIGVEALRDGETRIIHGAQIVLCGGAIATPGILLRSGIGSKKRLDAMGVTQRVESPVGEQLLDHPGAGIILVPHDGVYTAGQPMIQTTMRYGSTGGQPNDMQLQPLSFLQMPMIPYLQGMAVMVGKSRARGRLVYRDDKTLKPRIEPGLGDHPEDRAKLLEAMRMGVEVAEHPAMARLGKLVWPTHQHLNRGVDDTAWMLPGTGSGYHPCGTAPMGDEKDERAVVDFHGRVRGVEGLLVADASIMPTIPTSNINLPTIMIGERFGEWLRDGTL